MMRLTQTASAEERSEAALLASGLPSLPAFFTNSAKKPKTRSPEQRNKASLGKLAFQTLVRASCWADGRKLG
ncbi:hypothetical protein [Tepidicaulis marinus]|jgi:hypothetical protein|uniref:hypothetical protein n=1 Tax=Tepidicaulis marinus TaxID=1333998 RepID=UPI0012E04393|nr:hypothetical protein [Tepidicaulis marinus]